MKLYVLIRGDLTPGQQLAQVGHVCAGLGAIGVEIPDPIVVLEVECQADLNYYSRRDPSSYVYRDPDHGGDTAMAVVCDGGGYEHLPLAGKGKAAMTVS